MNGMAIHLFGVGFYGAATALLWRSYRFELPGKRVAGLWLGVVALLCHGLSLQQTVLSSHGLDLNLLNALSLIGWMLALTVIILNASNRLTNLIFWSFPLAALLMAFNGLIAAPERTVAANQPGLLLHISLSIVAFSLLTLTALQATLLAMQNYQLKHNHTSLLLRNLPPLQTMERLLFEIMLVGQALLTLSIVLGFFFVDNLFAQQLVHKTFFSMLAWLVFLILLLGRFSLGWRGRAVSQWTMAGVTLLILSYLGSKFVLEIVLQGGT